MCVRDIFYYNIIIPRSFVNTRRERARARKSLTSARGLLVVAIVRTVVE